MKYFYITYSRRTDEGIYADVLRVNENIELTGALDIPGIVYANICRTKKAAYDMAMVWNDAYRKNGTYAF